MGRGRVKNCRLPDHVQMGYGYTVSIFWGQMKGSADER